MTKSQHSGSFISLPYHCQLCIHKLRTRFNLQNNTLTAKYNREVFPKSQVNSVSASVRTAFNTDKNLYTEPELAETGSFQSLKNKFQWAMIEWDKANRNTKVFLLNNEKLRHLSLRLTSLSEPGPSVLCQQPGTATAMWGRWGWEERGRGGRKRDRENKHRTRLKFLGKKTMWPLEEGKTVENHSHISFSPSSTERSSVFPCFPSQSSEQSWHHLHETPKSKRA